jgi:NADH-ubiquinone oxidoreductase chain 5
MAYATHSTLVSPNVISILLGWDGLGLVSYFLVIYYKNVRSYGANMLIVLSNRIGDVALLIVIAWIINFGSWNFIYYFEFLSGSVEIEIISFLLVLAVMTMAYATHSTLKSVPTLPREWQVAITV